MIGIIFHPKKLERIAQGIEEVEHVPYYYHFAHKKKINLFFFAIGNLNYKTLMVKGYVYDYQARKLISSEVRLPQVNMLRTIVQQPTRIKMMRRIERKHSTTFLNLLTERNKYKINCILRQNRALLPYIPETRRLSYSRFLRFLQRNGSCIIKPLNGALGENICAIERVGELFTIRYTRQQRQHQLSVPLQRIGIFYRRNFPQSTRYLLQPLITFQEYEGSKFDLRTSVQKDKKGKWKVTGIVSRVAKPDGIVTNIAQGGRAVSYRYLLPQLEPALQYQLKQVSIEVAKTLEKYYPSTTDLGLDLAVDGQNKLWFIEANYCDERYAYREAQDMGLWKAVYETPISYAYALYRKKGV